MQFVGKKNVSCFCMNFNIIIIIIYFEHYELRYNESHHRYLTTYLYNILYIIFYVDIIIITYHKRFTYRITCIIVEYKNMKYDLIYDESSTKYVKNTLETFIYLPSYYNYLYTSCILFIASLVKSMLYNNII